MWVLRALAALMLLTGAAWADSLVSLSDQTSALGYAPAAQLKVTVNGAVTTLGAALAASGGCTTNCNFSTPTITGGSISGAAVAATTLSATGVSNLGAPSITTGILNIGGTGNAITPGVNGTLVNSQISFAYPGSGTATRPRYDYDTITISGTSTGVNESNWFGSEFTGTGTIVGEQNAIHCYQQYDAGITVTGDGECVEANGYNYTTGFGTHGLYTGLFRNVAGATITGTIVGLNFTYINDNTTAGSWAGWVGVGCGPNSGVGTPATSAFCLRNTDPAQAIVSSGTAVFGGLAASGGVLSVEGLNTSHFAYNTTFANSNNLQIDYFMNDGGLKVGANGNDGGSDHAMFEISDVGGTSTYGTHMAVVQTTAPTVTNGTLDAQASDVAGTITLTAANPSLTFHVGYATVPHVVISSPTGTAFTYSPNAGGITFTGGASGNTVTYMVMQ